MNSPPTKTPNFKFSAWGLDHWFVVCLLLIWTITIVVVNPSGDFPLMDDWVYGLVVRNILETGQFRFISPASSNLFTQAYWGALFCLPTGFSFLALRCSTIVLASMGITSLYSMIREINCPRKIAALASLLLIFNPYYLGLATTFMTDVPFTALLIICFYFYVIALKRDSKGHLAAALAIGFLALGVRQYALIFIAALCFGYLLKRGIRLSTLALATGTLSSAIAFQLLYQYWLRSSGQSPDSDPVTSSYFKGIATLLRAANLKDIISILIYIGAFTFPILWIYLHKLLSRKPFRPTIPGLLIAGCAGISVVLLWTRFQLPLFENILTHYGIGPLTLRDHFLLGLNHPAISPLGLRIWRLLSLGGAIGFLILSVLLAQALFLSAKHYNPFLSFSSKRVAIAQVGNAAIPDEEPYPYWLIATLAISIISYILILCIGHIFDRYILPLFPLSMILACSLLGAGPIAGHGLSSSNLWNSRASMPVLISLMSFYVYFSMASSHDYLAWSRARWQALHDVVVVKRISPRLIDGGYEFNGWYLSDRNYESTPEKSYWWVDQDDYMIASGLLKSYREIGRYAFQRWLPIENRPILVLRKTTID